MKNRIMIIGDAGRGKTTLAKRLSEENKIKFYSTDDFVWKKRFTEMYSKEERKERFIEVFKNEKWIVEGSSLRLLEEGIEKADIIIYLGFKNIFSQYIALYKRHLKRDYEKTKYFLDLIKHITYKRYKMGYKKNTPTTLEVLKPFEHKVVKLYFLRDINEFSL